MQRPAVRHRRVLVVCECGRGDKGRDVHDQSSLLVAGRDLVWVNAVEHAQLLRLPHAVVEVDGGGQPALSSSVPVQDVAEHRQQGGYAYATANEDECVVPEADIAYKDQCLHHKERERGEEAEENDD